MAIGSGYVAPRATSGIGAAHYPPLDERLEKAIKASLATTGRTPMDLVDAWNTATWEKRPDEVTHSSNAGISSQEREDS